MATFPSVVQTAVTDGTTATVTAKYASAQTAGNANIICVAWGDNTHTISTPTDTESNAYKLVGAKVYTGTSNNISMSIFVCPIIKAAAANANTVSVVWNALATFPEVYIIEVTGQYAAVAIDMATFLFADGDSTLPSAGPVETDFNNELCFGYCFNWENATGAGTGWTKDSKSPTSNGSLLETKQVTGAGTSVTATTPITPAADWVQVVFGVPSVGNSRALYFGSD
jgi:hypothetical protein